ncbi:Lateral organ boundary [Sesbania bispinosa]|nr:Lateral organ boundary [Sesbania bispinosa]
MSSSSSNSSPCAACKIQRRKCTEECVFAPYFPPDNPQRFAYVHKVFGASNVAKLLNEVNATQREDAVKSLAYEAEARLKDPVYGCVGLISLLQHKLKHLQNELNNAKKELASYIGPHAMLPQPPRNPPLFPFNTNPVTTTTPQPHDFFAFNHDGASTSQVTALPLCPPDHSFPHQLMFSPQPHHSFLSQKLFKSESHNHAECRTTAPSD